MALQRHDEVVISSPARQALEAYTGALFGDDALHSRLDASGDFRAEHRKRGT